MAEAKKSQDLEDDPALRYVDPNNRTELSRFQSEGEAQLACGLLRSFRVACELSPEVLPGLPSDLVLWVNNHDAEKAWAILADAEHGKL
jgi:hypothetical protein